MIGLANPGCSPATYSASYADRVAKDRADQLANDSRLRVCPSCDGLVRGLWCADCEEAL